MLKMRVATLADRDAIMHVEHHAFDVSIQEKESVFEQRLQYCKNCCLVFEDTVTGVIAGYVTAERWKTCIIDAKSYTLGHSVFDTHCDDGSVLYISSFAVLPEYQGKGKGSALFTNIINWFIAHNAGITEIVLLVNEAWAAARHIYSNAGFSLVCTFPSFFNNSDGTHTAGILMRRSLQ